jgi:hypothetical protein
MDKNVPYSRICQWSPIVPSLLPDSKENPVLCRKMTVRAVKTIEKDEEILASYYDANVSVQIFSFLLCIEGLNFLLLHPVCCRTFF